MQVLVLAVQNAVDYRGPRRRDVGRDAVPVDGRLDRRLDLRRDLRQPAGPPTWPTSFPHGLPAPAADRSRSPGRDRQAAAGDPRAVRHRVRRRAAARVPGGRRRSPSLAFALTWFLREVPLRETVGDQHVDEAFLANLFAAPRDETSLHELENKLEPARPPREPPLGLPGARRARRGRPHPAAALAPVPRPRRGHRRGARARRARRRRSRAARARRCAISSRAGSSDVDGVEHGEEHIVFHTTPEADAILERSTAARMRDSRDPRRLGAGGASGADQAHRPARHEPRRRRARLTVTTSRAGRRRRRSPRAAAGAPGLRRGRPWPVMPLRTSTVRDPPRCPRAMSMSRSSPMTASRSGREAEVCA